MKIIALKSHATGNVPADDELLELAVLDGDGNPVFFGNFKPARHDRWDAAEKQHAISPANVANARPLVEYSGVIENILADADLIVGNGITGFDLPIIFGNGIWNTIRDNCTVIDLAHYQTDIPLIHTTGTAAAADPFAETKDILRNFYRIFGDPPEIPADAIGIYHYMSRHAFHRPVSF